ncbi:MAG: putative aldo/keto reductase, partial [Sphingomonas bacterium]|nr:putative aldo/keto reductase [Sphingomonas bacterium]
MSTMTAPYTTALPLRRLGTTDMAITRVGFGAWAIGGPDWAVGWGAQDDRESVR